MGTHYRTVRDPMGEVKVPADALYGAQTQRAAENFPISGRRLQRPFLRALGLIKGCAARVNAEMGQLDAGIASAIEAASDDVAKGRYDTQFVVDVFQTGSGTSTNMNANEIIGELAHAHPNDQVNRSQSSNDVFPAAMHIAFAEETVHILVPEMKALSGALKRKETEFWEVFKIGRTHLQDAVPIRLGQEFGGYARQVDLAEERINAALKGLYELPLGGTAAGTGVNAPPGFGALVAGALAERTGLPFHEAQNHFEAQAAKDACGFLSGALRSYAISLTKIANDIRWLGSGPRSGLGEIRLPAVQPGSSIMPGKVNPVIAESVLMVCAQVIGHDAAVSWACAGGNFELNTMMPLIAYNVLDSIALLAAATRNFAVRCVDGLEADKQRAGHLLDQSLAMGTVLASKIGYERAAAIVQEAWKEGKSVREVAQAKSGLSAGALDDLFDVSRQV